jgi:MFS family permease
MSATSVPSTSSRVSPQIIVLCGCLIALITFGPRASAGLFQIPMTVEYGWGRDVFSLAIALQNLLWGVGQPFAGAVADRFGAFRVLCGGALLYAAGLVVMAYATSPGLMHLGAGFLIGFGLSGCSFNLVLGPSASSCRSSGGPWPSGPERRRAPSASSCSRPSATC